MRRSNRLLRAAAFAVALALSTAAATVALESPAFAQEAELEAKLKQATEDYDVLMIAEAKAALEEAIQMAQSQGYSGSVLADIYIMRGIIEHAETRDDAVTKAFFTQALQIDRSAEIDPVYQTPTLTELMETARQEVGPAEPGGGSGGEAPSVEGFTHEAIATAEAGQPLLFEVFVPADMPVFRVLTYYRRFGESAYEPVELEPTSATRFATELPAREVRTSQIDYYIEALDRGGNVIATAGEEPNPFNITVLGSSEVSGGGGTGGGTGGGQIEEEFEPDEPGAKKGYFMLALGTGAGFLPGGEPTANPNRDVQGGFAPAFGHLLLDGGYMISERAHVGMYFRWQFAPGQDFNDVPDQSKEAGSFLLDSEEECFGLGLPGDCLLGVKSRWFFQNTADLRLYSTAQFGFGRVRDWLELKEVASDPACEGKTTTRDAALNRDVCFLRDTVRPGWMHVGVGGGVAYPLTDYMDLAGEAIAMVLFPDTAVNFDVNLGAVFRF